MVCIPFARSTHPHSHTHFHRRSIPLLNRPHHRMLPSHPPRRPHRIGCAFAPRTPTAVPHLVLPLGTDRALLLVPYQRRRHKETECEDRGPGQATVRLTADFRPPCSDAAVVMVATLTTSHSPQQPRCREKVDPSAFYHSYV